MTNGANTITKTNEFKNFFMNLKNTRKKLQKDSKKYFGHSLYNKKNSLFVNIFLMLGFIVPLCFLNDYLAVLYPIFQIVPFAGTLIATVAILSTTALTNTLHKIFEKGKGKISRTYCRMQFYKYFKDMEYNFKRTCPSVIKNRTLTPRSIKELREFEEYFSELAWQINYKSNELNEKISKMKPKRQKKWQPVKDEVDEINQYFKLNLEKYKQLLSEYSSVETDDLTNKELNQELINVHQNDKSFVHEEIKKIPTDFEMFKDYLIKQKRLRQSNLASQKAQTKLKNTEFLQERDLEI